MPVGTALLLLVKEPDAAHMHEDVADGAMDLSKEYKNRRSGKTRMSRSTLKRRKSCFFALCFPFFPAENPANIGVNPLHQFGEICKSMIQKVIFSSFTFMM